MKISRIIYGAIVLLLAWAYFQPWMISGTQAFPGWSTVLLSFFYFVGLIMAFIVFSTGYRAVSFSIISGVLMVGNNLIIGVLLGLISLSKTSHFGTGFSYAFFLSIVFLILGPICGSGFDKTKHVKIYLGKGFWSDLLLSLGISILTAIILHYLFHIG
jgi:hypothetical protein